LTARYGFLAGRLDAQSCQSFTSRSNLFWASELAMWYQGFPASRYAVLFRLPSCPSKKKYAEDVVWSSRTTSGCCASFVGTKNNARPVLTPPSVAAGITKAFAAPLEQLLKILHTPSGIVGAEAAAQVIPP